MSESPSLETIMHRFLENRESLSDAEFQLLLEALRTQPHLAERLKDHLILDELLAQQYVMDRKDFIGQFEQRLREETKATPDSPSPTRTYPLRRSEPSENNGDSARTQANGSPQARKEAGPPPPSTTPVVSQESQKPEAPASGHPWRTFFLVIAGLFLLAGGLLRLEYTDAARKIAVVKEVTGMAILYRDHVGTIAKEGMPILPGDEIRVQEDSHLNLTYRDQSRVGIQANSQVVFQPGIGRWPGLMTADLRKEIFLSAGRLEAGIEPQLSHRSLRLRTPQVEVEVLGTRLLVAVESKQSRVEVIEGRVEVRSQQREEPAVEVTSGHQLVASQEEFRVTPGPWPTQTRGLVFLLSPTATLSRTLQQGVRIFAEGPNESSVVLRPRSDAEFHQGQMQFRSGAILAEDRVASELLARCQQTNELSLEATFQTAEPTQTGPARWITFSTSSHAWNFSLAQEGRWCILRLLTSTKSGGKQQIEIPLFEIPDDQPHHLAVTYSPGYLRCYLDGKPVALDFPVQGTFASWTPQHLLFGDEWNGDRKWKGSLSGVAIYNRALSAGEIARNRLHFRLRFQEQAPEKPAEE